LSYFSWNKLLWLSIKRRLQFDREYVYIHMYYTSIWKETFVHTYCKNYNSIYRSNKWYLDDFNSQKSIYCHQLDLNFLFQPGIKYQVICPRNVAFNIFVTKFIIHTCRQSFFVLLFWPRNIQLILQDQSLEKVQLFIARMKNSKKIWPNNFGT
jgi:hypothetical protein